MLFNNSDDFNHCIVVLIKNCIADFLDCMKDQINTMDMGKVRKVAELPGAQILVYIYT